MRTIAIVNQKGGVGKTTTAVNLSAALAANGKSVGLIDLDAQSHASLHFGILESEGMQSTYDVMCGESSLDDLWQDVSVNVSVAPACRDLAAAELELSGESDRHGRLASAIATMDRKFDYLLIDCPPSLGIASLNALVAAEEVLLPLEPHFLALDGLGKLLDTLRMVANRLNPKLKLAGVVCCMFDRQTRHAREVTSNIETFLQEATNEDSPWSGAYVFSTRIRRNIRLAEAPSFGRSILDYAPKSAGASDYRALAVELVAQAMQTESSAA